MSSSPSAVDVVDNAGDLGDWSRPPCADGPGIGFVDGPDGDVFSEAWCTVTVRILAPILVDVEPAAHLDW